MKKRIVVVDDQTGSYFQDMQPPYPDLILLDIFLDGEDGRAICHRLKSDEETSHIPIILLSAHANDDQAMRASGNDDFLSKPFHLDALFKLVERYTHEPDTEAKSPLVQELQ